MASSLEGARRVRASSGATGGWCLNWLPVLQVPARQRDVREAGGLAAPPDDQRGARAVRLWHQAQLRARAARHAAGQVDGQPLPNPLTINRPAGASWSWAACCTGRALWCINCRACFGRAAGLWLTAVRLSQPAHWATFCRCHPAVNWDMHGLGIAPYAPSCSALLLSEDGVSPCHVGGFFRGGLSIACVAHQHLT